MNIKNQKPVSTILFMAVILTGCGGGQNAPTPAPSLPVITERTVITDPTDSTLYKMTTAKGETLAYYGRRDSSGNTSVISTLNYTDEKGDLYLIQYDEQGLPKNVTDKSGTTVELTYNRSNKASNLGKPSRFQKSDIDLASIESLSVSFTSMGSDDVPLNVETRITPETPIILSLDQAIEEQNKIDPLGNVRVNIQKCGEAFNPKGGVWINYQGINSQFIDRYPIYPTSVTGQFVGMIPQRRVNESPISAKKTEEICTSFANALSKACNVFSPVSAGVVGSQLFSNPAFQASVCSQMAIAVSVAATPAAGVTAGAACGALFAGSTLACGTLGFSGDPTIDGNNIMQWACSNTEESLNYAASRIDSLGFDKLTLQAIAKFSTGTATISVPGANTGVVASDKVAASAFGPYPDIAINSLQPTIENIKISPSHPKAGEKYSATIDMSCVKDADVSLVVSRDDSPLLSRILGGFSQRDSYSINIPADSSAKMDLLEVQILKNENNVFYSENQARAVIFTRSIESNWKSTDNCTGVGDINYAQKWSVSLKQDEADVSGYLYFHACPGAGRVSYKLSGRASSNSNTFNLTGSKVGGQGDLYSSSPRTQDFTLIKNIAPTPNFAP